MATIGKLTKQNDGSYKGFIGTLSLYAKISMRENTDQTPNAPKYRLFTGAGECGAAFEQEAEKTRDLYLSLKLDDPTFTAPIYCAAFPNKEKPDDLDIVWNRLKPKE